MKILKYKTEQEGLDARLGRITGTRLGDITLKRGGGARIGFYELVAERICIPASEEHPMDRGKRLEDNAIEIFSRITGKKVNNDLVLWYRDEDDNIAVSPDGSIGKTEAVEVKCLSSARHIEAGMTKTIPSEYDYQVLQYFIVNDKLRKLYFIFYDPRCPKHIFWIEVNRKDKEEEIKEYLELEKEVLKKVEEIEKELVF